MIKVIYEDNHLLVVEKPCNVPVQEDSSQDTDLLTMAKQYIKEKYNKPGEVFLGLVQRLDRPVGGVLVFARTSKAAARLSKQISSRETKKKYYAIVCGQAKSQDQLEDYLIKDNRTNTVYTTTEKDGKIAKLNYTCIAKKNDQSLVLVELETGRSHQIRVQFSSRNLPLWGDQRYNKSAVVGQQIALWSYQLTLCHPTTKEMMTFTCNTPNTNPWINFKEELK